MIKLKQLLFESENPIANLFKKYILKISDEITKDAAINKLKGSAKQEAKILAQNKIKKNIAMRLINKVPDVISTSGLDDDIATIFGDAFDNPELAASAINNLTNDFIAAGVQNVDATKAVLNAFDEWAKLNNFKDWKQAAKRIKSGRLEPSTKAKLINRYKNLPGAWKTIIMSIPVILTGAGGYQLYQYTKDAERISQNASKDNAVIANSITPRPWNSNYSILQNIIENAKIDNKITIPDVPTGKYKSKGTDKIIWSNGEFDGNIAMYKDGNSKTKNNQTIFIPVTGTFKFKTKQGELTYYSNNWITESKSSKKDAGGFDVSTDIDVIIKLNGEKIYVGVINSKLQANGFGESGDISGNWEKGKFGGRDIFQWYNGYKRSL